jgi:hypothetical protein
MLSMPLQQRVDMSLLYVFTISSGMRWLAKSAVGEVYVYMYRIDRRR